MMKKNHSEEFKALWKVNQANRLMLVLTVVVRVLIAASFIYYILANLFHFAHSIEVVAAFILVVIMIFSRRLKRSSIGLERMFILNLRSRDIEAQVHGHKRPLYEGHLLDRDIHISDVEVPEDSQWAGLSLRQLQFGSKFGIHVSSVLRGRQRMNIPGGDTVLFPGDRVQVIGSDEQLTAFLAAMNEAVIPDDPDVEKREMRLRQIVISGSSPFVGKKLRDSGIREEYDCMVVGLEEGKETLSHPDPNHVFRKGDIVWVVGEKDSLDRLSK
jgi:CPA2 family monovalent cation:H+ antiporter-2